MPPGDGILARIRALFRPPSPPAIIPTATGFEIRAGDTVHASVAWTAVRRVVAYKQDLYTTDCIMLTFERDPDGVVELSERMRGFTDLFAPMESALGVSAAWYIEIMMPAFEPTPRLLYERTDGTA